MCLMSLRSVIRLFRMLLLEDESLDLCSLLVTMCDLVMAAFGVGYAGSVHDFAFLLV